MRPMIENTMTSSLVIIIDGGGGGIGDDDWACCCYRLAGWAALVFLWGLAVFEFLTLSFVRSY